MSTLKELFDKHGSVWLADKDKPNGKSFKPLAYSERHDTFIIGETNFYNTPATFFTTICDGFILYEEPKPKVKRYQYVYQRNTDRNGFEWNNPESCNGFYKDDEDFKRGLSGSDDLKMFKRLDSTMQEFDW